MGSFITGLIHSVFGIYKDAKRKEKRKSNMKIKPWDPIRKQTVRTEFSKGDSRKQRLADLENLYDLVKKSSIVTSGHYEYVIVMQVITTDIKTSWSNPNEKLILHTHLEKDECESERRRLVQELFKVVEISSFLDKVDSEYFVTLEIILVDTHKVIAPKPRNITLSATNHGVCAQNIHFG